MDKQLQRRFNNDSSVDALKWWIEAGKDLTKFTLKTTGQSVPDESVLNNVEKSLTDFATHLLGSIDLSPDAHKRVSWVSDKVSTLDLKECIQAAEIVVKQAKGFGCCGGKEKPPPSRPF